MKTGFSLTELLVVVVVLAFLFLGTLLGALSLLGLIFRQRREISRLKRAAVNPEITPKYPEPPAAL